MVALTSQEIAYYRSQLAQFPEALEALDAIEDCEGDLEDAALSLAIHAGQQPDRNDWLEGMAKRCRVAICQSPAREAIHNQQLSPAIAFLIEAKICPSLLLTPIILYVMKVGLEDFCEPLNEKIL
jgi:hypothetical protein